jgi:curved DNA-binding protein
MPRVGGGFGDLYAKARLVLPDTLTDAQRRLFEELRATSATSATSTGSTSAAADRPDTRTESEATR